MTPSARRAHERSQAPCPGWSAGRRAAGRHPGGGRTGGRLHRRAGEPVGPPATAGPPATVGGTSPGARPTPPAAAGFVRTCESSVYGELEANWRRQSLAVGPLTFVYLREAANELAAGPPGRAGVLHSRKTLVTVDRDASVTVTVPPADRRHVSLLYNPATWNDSGTYRVADGDPVVTFEGCRPGAHPYGADHTQFNGGFLVDGPRCVTLDVSTPAWRTPRRVTVSFGAGRCPG